MERALAAAREHLSVHSVVARSRCGSKNVRDEVVARLASEGFEVSGASVRVPLATQLSALLATGARPPVSQLARTLKGAKMPEIRALLAAMVESGAARLVVRGKFITVVSSGERAVDVETIREVQRVAEELIRWVKAGAKAKPRATLLVADLGEKLKELEGLLGTATMRDSPDLRAEVISLIRARTDVRLGVAFVPEVVRGLPASSFEAARTLLVELAREEKVELRPEGGFSRVSREDAELCPRGASGALLSYVRVREEEG